MANLDTKKYDEIYKKCEEHFFGYNSETSDNPRLIFVLASPGAGKTTVVKPQLQKEFGNEKAIMLEIDEVKAFLPKELNKKDYLTLRSIWIDRLIAKAISEKRSIAMFSAYLDNKTMKTCVKAKENGFQTEAVFLALNINKSRLGMAYRYEQALKNENTDITNYPRKPKLINHYLFYKALPIILEICDKKKTVDVIRVFDRELNLLAFNDKIKKKKSDISLLKALVKERHRKWTNEETTEYNNQKNEVRELKQKRKDGINRQEIKDGINKIYKIPVYSR